SPPGTRCRPPPRGIRAPRGVPRVPRDDGAPIPRGWGRPLPPGGWEGDRGDEGAIQLMLLKGLASVAASQRPCFRPPLENPRKRKVPKALDRGERRPYSAGA